MLSATHLRQKVLRDVVAHSKLAEKRRVTTDNITNIHAHALNFVTLPFSQQLLQAVAGGALVSFGALLSIVLADGFDGGAKKFMLGLGFVAGFYMVIVSNSALYTESNVSLTTLLLRRDYRVLGAGPIVRAWVVVFFGNFLGALSFGLLTAASDAITDSQGKLLADILDLKLMERDNSVQGWFRTLDSAILGNWLVGMAALLASSGRTMIGKLVAVFFPVVGFAAIGFQHSPANMGYFSVGFFGSLNNGIVMPVNWGHAIAYNIIPAAIGNLVGGVVFVATLFFYAYGSNRVEPGSKKDDGEDEEAVAGDSENGDGGGHMRHRVEMQTVRNGAGAHRRRDLGSAEARVQVPENRRGAEEAKESEGTDAADAGDRRRLDDVVVEVARETELDEEM